MNTPTYRRLEPEQRREQILDAANALFAERAYDEVTIEDIAGAAAAIPQVAALDRARIRMRFEQRFTAAKMAEKHIQLYERIVAASGRTDEPRASALASTNLKVSN